MNSREAKREACKRARGVIISAVEGSDAEWLGDMYGEDDALKVEQALLELADELGRRAG